MKEPGFDLKKLHKVFFTLSIALFTVLVGSFLGDYFKPWRSFQVKALEIEKNILQDRLLEQDKNLDKNILEELDQSYHKEKQNVARKQGKIQELQKEIRFIDGEILPLNSSLSKSSSELNALIFQYEASGSKDAKLLKKIEERREVVSLTKDKIKLLEEKKKDFLQEQKNITQELVKIEKAQEEFLAQQKRTSQALEKTEQNFIWLLRNAPFLDYIDPTIKPDQLVLKNLKQDFYFASTFVVDTCKTCHVFIDKKGFEKQEQPYKTHSQLGILVGEGSPHSFKEFGCTTCHEGNGRKFHEFNAPAHRPQNEEQKKEWERKYAFKESHHEPYPMLPLQFTEASCQKCHSEEVRVTGANKLNEGKHLVETAGCYACHEIKNFHFMPKVGPNLDHLPSKMSKDYLLSWIYYPHNLNPKSRMPAFFNLSNQKDSQQFNLVEVHSMGEYLWKKSTEKKPLLFYKKGSKEKGQELFKSIGCLACHQAPQEEVSLAKRGPYLFAPGSKLNPDWLVSWIKNPKYYNAKTIMPSFRLKDDEIQDLATYLLSLKSSLVEETKLDSYQEQSLDQLVLYYLKEFASSERAQKNLLKMNKEEKLDYLALKSIQKYGCYSCHELSFMDKDIPGIGPELNKIGEKPLSQLGFGTQKIEHSRQAWLKEHLLNPRIWDEGVPSLFKDRKKMPKFFFTEQEADKIVTFLLGLKKSNGEKKLSDREKLVEEGRQEMMQKNCYSCHKIAGHGGDILPLYEEDENLGPPWLVQEGARVKSSWLYEFLDQVSIIRPNIKVKMPSYDLSHESKMKIIKGFEAEAKVDFLTNPLDNKVSLTPEENLAVNKMMNELICVTCHTQGFNQSPAKAPDLKLSAKRLRRDWIKDWMRHPQKYLPYTSMPNFWEEGQSTTVDYLNKDPNEQLEAFTKWIINYGQ